MFSEESKAFLEWKFHRKIAEIKDLLKTNRFWIEIRCSRRKINEIRKVSLAIHPWNLLIITVSLRPVIGERRTIKYLYILKGVLGIFVRNKN